MDALIAILIITIAIINAIYRYTKDKEKRDLKLKTSPRRKQDEHLAGRGRIVKPASREQHPLAEFLRKLQEIQIEKTPPKRPVKVPEPAPPELPVAEEVKEEEEPMPITPMVTLAAPVSMPLIPVQEIKVTAQAPSLELSQDSVKRGVIVAEILGPPLARRKAGVRSRRLF